jgi:hypothetical protein
MTGRLQFAKQPVELFAPKGPRVAMVIRNCGEKYMQIGKTRFTLFSRLGFYGESRV